MSQLQQVGAAPAPSPRSIGRLRWARMLVHANGARWTACAAVLSGLKHASRLVEGEMTRLERRQDLDGRNATAINYAYWQEWDWSRQGEEWTLSEKWKQSVVDEVMHRYIRSGATVLEIGPGGGRWTEALQTIAGHLVIVDLADRCIEICRQRFAQAQNMEFHVNDGRTLPFLDPVSVDAVWSFDVFVHIAVPDIKSYLAEIARVLRPGGRAVIHHAAAGRNEAAQHVGQRSRMTAVLFATMAREEGLALIEQFESWGPDGQFRVPTEWDIVSVIEKPA